MTDKDIARRVAGHTWWHTIEVAPSVVTPGWWDLRPTAARLPWPGSLVGLRCLDIGTMDGFWAFELERRGAGEVHAVSAPLSLLPAPLARLCARGGQLEWFVFNRAGLAQALALAGFEIEAVTRILRDRPGPAVTTARLAWSVRVRHALGLLGRSVAVRGRVPGRRPV